MRKASLSSPWKWLGSHLTPVCQVSWYVPTKALSLHQRCTQALFIWSAETVSSFKYFLQQCNYNVIVWHYRCHICIHDTRHTNYINIYIIYHIYLFPNRTFLLENEKKYNSQFIYVEQLTILSKPQVMYICTVLNQFSSLNTQLTTLNKTCYF